MKELLLNVFLLLWPGLAHANSETNIYSPVIVSKYKNPRGIPLFEGKIKEDESTVRLDPVLAAYDNDTIGAARLICRYEIVSNRKHIPFVIELKDRFTGAADIKVKEGDTINYVKRQHYKFNIFAYDCVDPPYDKRSNRAVVTIKVSKDAVVYPPVFDSYSLFVEMHEAEIYQSIMQLAARDDDRMEEKRGICGYDIQTPDVPFTVDENGNLKNTKEIQFTDRYNFILKVVARGCGGMVSQPAYINIVIKETCRSGWQGFPDHIDYTPSSGREVIAENAHLQICDESCVPDHINVRMMLATKHIGKGCDRDTYSITSQRKLCGASDETIDLLPSPTLISNWTGSLPTDDGNDGDKVYGFNGISDAVVVPDGYADHRLRTHFTIATWMKHTFPNTVVTNHKLGNKEHILCMSDGDGMSRHHYAWLIHNSKLIFILRRESEDVEDLDVFKPAEFRWNLPSINDGQWHHYGIAMNFPEVSLYVDGKLVVADKDNTEVLDDWPLHPTDRVHFTKLVIGACWKGADQTFTDHFQGFLAGLSLLKDKTESERVITCLNSCQENLSFQALDDMPSGTSLSFNSDMTEMSITGNNASEVEQLVRDVAYVNTRTFPTPGRRNLNVHTSVHCGNVEEVLPLVESYIFVEHSNSPVITISGKPVVTGTAAQFAEGINILSDASIHVDFHGPPRHVDNSQIVDDVEYNGSEEKKKPKLDIKLSKATLMQDSMDKKDDSDDFLLDMCSIRAEPVLNFYVEHIDLPQDEIRRFNMKLEGIETAAGLVILNVDTIKNYLTVIRNIRYTHSEADKLHSRRFVINCSSQSGRFVSNDFEIEVAPVIEEPLTIMRAHAKQSGMEQNVLKPHIHENLQLAVGTNFGMVAIIVVCVGFLLFMIVLGVLRIRSAHHRTRVVQVDEKQEMEWDNSELNITVNPIEQELFEYEENPRKTQLQDDSDTDDDVSDFHDDDRDSSDDDEEEVNVKTLEWDDSTLSY